MPEDISKLIERVEVLIRLIALGIVAEKPQQEKIQFLSNAGLAPKDIADMIGTTPNTVRVALAALRKKKKKTKKRRKKVNG